MTREDRERAFSDASSHMALAESALLDLLRDGASAENGRDIILAHGVNDALKTQRRRIARRLNLGRHR